MQYPDSNHACKDTLYGIAFVTWCSFIVSTLLSNVAGAVTCTVLLLVWFIMLTVEVMHVHFPPPRLGPTIVQIC